MTRNYLFMSLKQNLKDTIEWLGFKITRLRLSPELSLPDGNWIDPQKIVEYEILKYGKTFRMLQIGSNDGLTSDPVVDLLKKYTFEAILIEPQKAPFQSLLALHEDRPLTRLLNCAVGKVDGLEKFYSVKPDKLSLFPGIGSTHFGFLKDKLIFQLASVRPDLRNFENFLAISEVPTRNVQSVLEEFEFHTLNFLQIDTEGYDAEIIYSLDLEVVSPHIINFEHTYLSSPERETLYRYLEDKGFSVVFHGNSSGDSTAYKRQVFSKILP